MEACRETCWRSACRFQSFSGCHWHRNHTPRLEVYHLLLMSIGSSAMMELPETIILYLFSFSLTVPNINEYFPRL